MPKRKLTPDENRGYRLRSKAQRLGADALTPDERRELARFDKTRPRTYYAPRKRDVVAEVRQLVAPSAPSELPPVDTTPQEPTGQPASGTSGGGSDGAEAPPEAPGTASRPSSELPPIDVPRGDEVPPEDETFSNAVIGEFVASFMLAEPAQWVALMQLEPAKAKDALGKLQRIYARAWTGVLDKYMPQTELPSCETVAIGSAVVRFGGPYARGYLEAKAQEAQQAASSGGPVDRPIIDVTQPEHAPESAHETPSEARSRSGIDAQGGY